MAGRTVLLHVEQGLGDTIQFIRYAALVKQAGGRVVVECPNRLLPLLASCPGIDLLVASGSPLPDFDVHAPLMSLPRIFKTRLLTIPADIPYLFVDAELREKWRCELSVYSHYKIGIAWQGNPHHHKDARRSFQLSHFGPLARLEGVCLFSLQERPGRRAGARCAPVTARSSIWDRSSTSRPVHSWIRPP